VQSPGNAAAFLGRCLDRVLHQSLTHHLRAPESVEQPPEDRQQEDDQQQDAAQRDAGKAAPELPVPLGPRDSCPLGRTDHDHDHETAAAGY